MAVEILGWRLQWPIKIVYSRERGFGWTWRGWWPIRRVRVLRYAHLSKQQDD